MVNKKTIPMFVRNGDKDVQVGWATPANNGVRAWSFLPGFKGTKLKDVSFGDDLPPAPAQTEPIVGVVPEPEIDEQVEELPEPEVEEPVETPVEEEEWPVEVAPADYFADVTEPEVP